MPTGEQPGGKDWEFLLSHHLPDRFDRTLALRTGGRTIHLCARCTGEVVGVVAWVGAWAVFGWLGLDLFSIPLQVVIVTILPLLASVDWITQSLGRRESTNPLRLGSGALVGFVVADLLGALFGGHWEAFAIGVIAVVTYLVVLSAVLWRSGAWRPVLEQHFPGIDLGPSD